MSTSVLYGDDITEIFMYLSTHSKDIDILECGETPLINAVKKGRTDVIDMLISFGANINIQNKYGYTALHFFLYFPTE